MALDITGRTKENKCPRDPTTHCISPGPIDGGCCKIQPDGPCGFNVHQRNDHHWDIGTRYGRAFRIRGEPGDVFLMDERNMDKLPSHPREPMKFKSIGSAMLWVSEEMLTKITHPLNNPTT